MSVGARVKCEMSHGSWLDYLPIIALTISRYAAPPGDSFASAIRGFPLMLTMMSPGLMGEPAGPETTKGTWAPSEGVEVD